MVGLINGPSPNKQQLRKKIGIQPDIDTCHVLSFHSQPQDPSFQLYNLLEFSIPPIFIYYVKNIKSYPTWHTPSPPPPPYSFLPFHSLFFSSYIFPSFSSFFSSLFTLLCIFHHFFYSEISFSVYFFWLFSLLKVIYFFGNKRSEAKIPTFFSSFFDQSNFDFLRFLQLWLLRHWYVLIVFLYSQYSFLEYGYFLI